jgi:hypothetical protein
LRPAPVLLLSVARNGDENLSRTTSFLSEHRSVFARGIWAFLCGLRQSSLWQVGPEPGTQLAHGGST